MSAIIRKGKKGKLIYEVQIDGLKHPMAIPSRFRPIDQRFNGRKCEVIREKEQILNILIDGSEVSHKNSRKVSTDGSDRRRNGSNIPYCMKSPDDTRRCLGNDFRTDNFSLLLNHLIPCGKPTKSRNMEIRKDFFKAVESKSSYLLPPLLPPLNSRYRSFIKMVMDEVFILQSFNGTVDWRMAIGLGKENVHEASVTLHHVYRIPYIPGSALKGIARDAAVQELIGGNEESDIMDALISLSDLSNLDNERKRKEIEKSGRVRRPDGTQIRPKVATVMKIINGWEKFRSAQRIFGGETQSGQVLFLDAYPRDKLNIKTDIMNPHYPGYYSECEPPADW